MPRFLRLLPVIALILGLSPEVSAQQDPPQSLGDVARKYREEKQKNQTQSKSVITNEDLSSGRGLGSLGLDKTGTPGKPVSDPTESFDRTEALIRKVQTMEPATLFTQALQGNTSDFPGRRNWEGRMLQAREIYVSHGMDLLRQLRQTWESAKALDASQPGGVPASDPRAQAIMARMKELVQDCVRTDAAFQAVVMEGRDLAKQASRP